MKPLGGTELQHGFLEKYVSKDLLDKFQICTSVPGKVPLSKNKINILWQKMAPDQPHFQDFLKIKKKLINMIIMFLTVIGTMNSLEKHFLYLNIVVQLLKMVYLIWKKETLSLEEIK